MIIQLPPISSLKILTERKDQMYVDLDGETLYVSNGEDSVLMFRGTDFSTMDGPEINKWLQDTLATEKIL